MIVYVIIGSYDDGSDAWVQSVWMDGMKAQEELRKLQEKETSIIWDEYDEEVIK